MPVQAESLKIALVSGLVTVLAGVFWSFYALLAYEAKIYLLRLLFFFFYDTLLWKDREKYETEALEFLKT